MMHSLSSSRRLFKTRRQGSVNSAMSSKPKSKLPSVGWTGPGLARRQCSEWLPRRNSGEYAPIPKLSPTTEKLPDSNTRAKVLYDDTNDSGSDMGKVKGVNGGSLYDASGEDLTSDSEEEDAVTKVRGVRGPKSVTGFTNKLPFSTVSAHNISIFGNDRQLYTQQTESSSDSMRCVELLTELKADVRLYGFGGRSHVCTSCT